MSYRGVTTRRLALPCRVSVYGQPSCEQLCSPALGVRFASLRVKKMQRGFEPTEHIGKSGALAHSAIVARERGKKTLLAMERRYLERSAPKLERKHMSSLASGRKRQRKATNTSEARARDRRLAVTKHARLCCDHPSLQYVRPVTAW